MKEHLTMIEAGMLIGKTPKTIKNYIKRGVIKNFFRVEGKYGQEYKISVRDLEPLGIINLDVLREDFIRDGKKNGKGVEISGEMSGLAEENDKGNTVPSIFISRYEEAVLELGMQKQKSRDLAEENLRLRQELEEKNMLIRVLMKKGKD